MKNIFKEIYTIIPCSLVFFSLTFLDEALASTQTSTPAIEQSETFQCPQEIVCTTDGDINSCKPTIYSTLQYQKYMILGGGPIKGTYTFIGAATSLNEKHIDTVLNSHCNYNLSTSSSRTSVDLYLYTRIYSALTFSNGPSTQWNHKTYSRDGRMYAECFALNGKTLTSSMCPFSVASGIGFYNVLISNPSQIESGGGPDISFTVNFNNITGVTNESITSGSVSFIPYGALEGSGCPDQCVAKIFIGLQDGRGGWDRSGAGSIIVNMRDNMKILELDSPYTFPNNIKLVQGPNNSLMLSQIKISKLPKSTS